jgi:hypothetical protein
MNPHTEEELNENICREIFESSSGRRSVCIYTGTAFSAPLI